MGFGARNQKTWGQLQKASCGFRTYVVGTPINSRNWWVFKLFLAQCLT